MTLGITMPYAPPTDGQLRRKQRKGNGRLSACKRGYGKRWQKARLHYLRQHPLCVRCRERGDVRAAEVVDHVTPHRGDQGLMWDQGNWQALCKPCHDRKTGMEDRT